MYQIKKVDVKHIQNVKILMIKLHVWVGYCNVYGIKKLIVVQRMNVQVHLKCIIHMRNVQNLRMIVL